MSRKKIVVFTGAGMSADSGISTFRDSDGLWEKYRIEDVCTAEAMINNRATVIEFYNARRRDMLTKSPNAGHYAICELENYFDVEVVTQNVDNLHERAGSTHITHLHGELTKLRSMVNPNIIVDCLTDQGLDDCGPDGKLLRPHIVFFGESVPMFDEACRKVAEADILVIVGTSLVVYPAASLIYYLRDRQVPVYLVDPATPDLSLARNPVTHIKAGAAVGVPQLVDILRTKYLGE